VHKSKRETKSSLVTTEAIHLTFPAARIQI